MQEHPQYNPEAIEAKWQKKWADSGVFKAQFPSDKPKYYCLIEFPYPSGNGLHVGHPRSNTALDIIARKRRMEGYNVLYPIGYDAFGLSPSRTTYIPPSSPKRTSITSGSSCSGWASASTTAGK